MFKVGDRVEHILSKDWLIVIEVLEKDLIRCRTKDLKDVVLNNWEVVLLKNKDGK